MHQSITGGEKNRSPATQQNYKNEKEKMCGRHGTVLQNFNIIFIIYRRQLRTAT
jgi:hypothetical protein